MMGKTRKVGYSNSWHAVETVAESVDFWSSGQGDAGLNPLRDTCVPNGKCISFNVEGFGRSVVPIRSLPLSKLSTMERRDLEVMLRGELEQVRKFYRKIASLNLDAVVHPHTIDIHSHQTGLKRLAVVESLPVPSNADCTTPGKKKGSSGRNGPRTKGGASVAKKTESVKQGGPQNTSSVLLMKQCETLLNRLMVHPHAWIFNKPVDIVAHKVPDYYDIIKHPMDLGTVKSKLLSNQYSTPMEFAADVRLTLKNAMTFNPPKHDVHVMAEIMSKYFEVRWKSIEKKIPPTTDESTASKSSIIVEPESAYVLPAKKQKTSCKEARVKNERDKSTMSEAEKQKLGIELEELIAEIPDNIINFLKESILNSDEVTEDEIEIDIDTLSDDTLLTVRKLLDDFLLEKKKQSMLEHRETEMQKESAHGDLSYLPCKDNEQADEDVDIGGSDPPPMSSSPIRISKDEDAAERNSKCSGSGSSTSELGASSTDSENSCANEAGVANNSVPEVHETTDTQGEPRGNDLRDRKNGDILENAEQDSVSSVEPNCIREGESDPPDRRVSPEKLYRAALLRSRFADIIIKAQENTTEKGERPDPEKLKLEREELERRRREEKARLQAEAKAAEEARRKAEAEAAAEARKKIEHDREAARQALQQMEKTVDINDNSQFMEDLAMFGPDEHSQSFTDEASPDISQNGLGSFKFPANSNPLEQLGLYMKNDEDEEEEVQPQSVPQESNDDSGGGID